jgi:hypothetical protein
MRSCAAPSQAPEPMVGLEPPGRCRGPSISRRVCDGAAAPCPIARSVGASGPGTRPPIRRGRPRRRESGMVHDVRPRGRAWTSGSRCPRHRGDTLPSGQGARRQRAGLLDPLRLRRSRRRLCHGSRPVRRPHRTIRYLPRSPSATGLELLSRPSTRSRHPWVSRSRGPRRAIPRQPDVGCCRRRVRVGGARERHPPHPGTSAPTDRPLRSSRSPNTRWRQAAAGHWSGRCALSTFWWRKPGRATLGSATSWTVTGHHSPDGPGRSRHSTLTCTSWKP